MSIHPTSTSSTANANDYLRNSIIGQHDSLKMVLHHANLVSKVDSSVLILGETGTGKELIAQVIHQLSPRCKKPLIRVNCAAIPENLFESELFGYEKGAFTSAMQAKPGRFELAHGGTVFLDEVGELPLELQAKLLRVLQEKEIERLGSVRSIPIDVRIITATNRNLEEEVVAGRFRPDLYFRLSVFPITLPPLRARLSDIPLLVQHILQKLNQRFDKKISGVSDRVMQQFTNYAWPGNIRELEHILERGAILCASDLIREVHFPQNLHHAAAPIIEPLHQNEKKAILTALKQSKWRIRGENGAANLLKIKPTTLEARMKKLGIVRRIFEVEE